MLDYRKENLEYFADYRLQTTDYRLQMMPGGGLEMGYGGFLCLNRGI
jgi:hypothetical protein